VNSLLRIFVAAEQSETDYNERLARHTNVFFMRVRIVAKSAVRLSARTSAAPTGRIFVKLDIPDFYENLPGKSKCG
jgi:hypothetical protein